MKFEITFISNVFQTFQLILKNRALHRPGCDFTVLYLQGSQIVRQ